MGEGRKAGEEEGRRVGEDGGRRGGGEDVTYQQNPRSVGALR